MIKIENIDVYGFESAIRGMRNPMNSWDRSDSWTEIDCERCNSHSECARAKVTGEGCIFVGENDLDLMKRLFKGGTEHRKYLRFIDVTMDITAPLYFFKEWDTYKIGTNCNSCSTMHKIHAKKFELDDFSHEHLIDSTDEEYQYENPSTALDYVICVLNHHRERFLETKDKKHWWQMIQLLPSSYNQRRTVKFNYEVAVRIIEQRKNHKLDEWHVMVDELMNLPYMKEIMGHE
jgi:hypothetical protein